MGILYFIIAFVIFFFRYKKREYIYKKNTDRYGFVDTLIDTTIIPLVILPALIWPAFYPFLLVWKLLSFIWKKMNSAYDSTIGSKSNN